MVTDCEFAVFKGALENGGSVRGINAKGQGAMPRKKIDKLVEFAKGYGAKGLAYIAIGEDGTMKSSFAKFMKEEEMAALISAMQGENGDLLLFAADKTKLVWDVLGALRLELIQEVNGESEATTVVDGETLTFPYKLDITGSPGVSEGTLSVSEMINGEYQQLGTYPLTFEKAE